VVEEDGAWRLGYYQVYLVSCFNCLLPFLQLIFEGFRCNEKCAVKLALDWIRDKICTRPLISWPNRAIIMSQNHRTNDECAKILYFCQRICAAVTKLLF